MTTTTSETTTPARATSSTGWLSIGLGLLVLLLGIHLFITWKMDVFGILRDPRGRQLSTSHHERKAKWLLNHRYVPANFDALIIGPSPSVNWHLKDLTGYRFYDESLEGGDAVELRMIVEQALKTGHFKVAIVGLYPHTTQVHYFWDGLDQANIWEAYGSLNSFGIEADDFGVKYLHHPRTFFPDGSHRMPVARVTAPKPGDPKLEVQQDPAAVKDYRELVQELLAHGIKVVYVVYPLFGPSYAYNKDEMAQYMESVKQNMPSAPLIDFNTSEFDAFRNDPNNYMDEVHLSEAGSTIFSPIVNARVHQALHDQ